MGFSCPHPTPPHCTAPRSLTPQRRHSSICSTRVRRLASPAPACYLCPPSFLSGCVVTEAFLQAPFPRPTRTQVRGRGQRGQEMLTPSVVGIERAVRHVRQVSGEGYGLTARRGTLRTKTRAGAIATTTAVTASRRSEGGEEEALHERQGGYTSATYLVYISWVSSPKFRYT